jgi:hypothetical protein
MLRTQHAKIVNLTDQLSPKAPGLTERELYLMGCALLAGEDYSDLDEWLREPVEDGGVDRETYLAKAATAKDEKNTEAEQ